MPVCLHLPVVSKVESHPCGSDQSLWGLRQQTLHAAAPAACLVAELCGQTEVLEVDVVGIHFHLVKIT